MVIGMLSEEGAAGQDEMDYQVRRDETDGSRLKGTLIGWDCLRQARWCENTLKRIEASQGTGRDVLSLAESGKFNTFKISFSIHR